MRAACRSAGAPHRAAEVDISIIRHVVSGEMVFFFFFCLFFYRLQNTSPALCAHFPALCVCLCVCVPVVLLYPNCCTSPSCMGGKSAPGERESNSLNESAADCSLSGGQGGRFSRDGCALIKYSLQVEWLRSGVNSSRGGIDNLRMVWCWFNPFLQILSCSSWNVCFCFLFKGNTL